MICKCHYTHFTWIFPHLYVNLFSVDFVNCFNLFETEFGMVTEEIKNYIGFKLNKENNWKTFWTGSYSNFETDVKINSNFNSKITSREPSKSVEVSFISCKSYFLLSLQKSMLKNTKDNFF